MENNRAYALTHQALSELDSVLELAEIPADFLSYADVIVNRKENLLPLPLDLGVPEHLDAVRGSERDIENAPLLYEYIGAIDPANASDRRLWTYLAFSTYREYMDKRWSLDEAKDWKRRVRRRWLMGRTTRGSLVRHGIARLWWVASLTYDPKKKYPLSQATGDSFAYTREVFRREDRLNSLFDREAGALPDLVRSVLEHAAQGGGYAKDNHIRSLMKELTLIYGYRDISYLDQDRLRALVAESAPILPKDK